MAERAAHNIVNLEPAQAALRDRFLGWQCRLRALAVRRDGGRPSPGMRPRLMRPDGAELAPAVTVLIVPRAPHDSTQLFRHLVRRSHDPRERYAKATAFLGAAHYQRPRDFDDRMTALFGAASAVVAALAGGAPDCVLDFAQFSQRFELPCRAEALAPSDPAWQHTYWHNRLFNPDLPPDIAILAFTPDWARTRADPPG